MPSAGGIRAGRALVELFADDGKLVHGLRPGVRALSVALTGRFSVLRAAFQYCEVGLC